jgi:hypothetical protein
MTDYVVNPGRGRSATHPATAAAVTPTAGSSGFPQLPDPDPDIEDRPEETAMTLRAVGDDERAVVPCEYGCGPATILVIINETPGIPCCDACARRLYNLRPDAVRLAPLAEYVDHYAIAREAALATPEQITGPVMQVVGPVIVDDEVLHRIWVDQAVYCHVHWCETQGKLTPADQRLNAIGGLWYPACADCIAKFDPAQVEVAPMSEAGHGLGTGDDRQVQERAQELDVDEAEAADEPAGQDPLVCDPGNRPRPGHHDGLYRAHAVGCLLHRRRQVVQPPGLRRRTA